MAQTLLVLGAGVYQMAAITTAQAMGVRVVAVDANPATPGLALAAVSRVVDVREMAGCLAVAREHRIDGVIAMVAERGVETAAAIVAELGLPGISPDAARCATDKFVMRQRLAAAGIPGPAFRQAETLAEALEAATDIGFPVVMKPVDNAGSRGVRRIESAAALPAAFELAVEQSLKRRVIVEQFMDGIEATAEALTIDGKTTVLAMSDKVHVPFPMCVSIALNYPAQFPLEAQDEIRRLVQRAAQALGIHQGPTHTELMVTADGVKVVEVAARGGGFRIFQDVVRLVSGVNLVQETLHGALGRPVHATPTQSQAVILRFFHPQRYGTLLAVRGVEEAKAVTGITHLIIEVEPGQPIVPITRDGDRPGYLIATGATRAEALQRAHQAEQLVRFDVLEGVTHSSRLAPVT